MNTINYILLAHNQPELLQRIISNLSHPKAFFFIHIDKNTNIKPFKEKTKHFKNIHFLSEENRKEGVWGGIGIVKATVTAMQKIIEINKSGYTILLSGQDYPLQNSEKIISFFAKNKFEYINSKPLTLSYWSQTRINRLKEYRINFSTKRYDFVKISSIRDKSFYNFKTIKNCYSLIKRNKSKTLKLLIFKRILPYNLEPHSGSQWWAISNSTVEKILNFIDTKPKYIEFHKHTLLCDEIFFQTIIEEVKRKERNIKIKKSVTYTNWTRKNTQLPVTFKITDKEELKKASHEFLFARKFNLETDNDILDWIDTNLL